jgi:hypothetical protein
MEIVTMIATVNVDLAKEVKATAYDPGAFDSGATPETVGAVLYKVDYLVDEFRAEFVDSVCLFFHVVVSLSCERNQVHSHPIWLRGTSESVKILARSEPTRTMA